MESAPLDVTERLVAHAATAHPARLAPDAVHATKTFVLDSLGVALSGTRVPLVADLKAVVRTWGTGDAARVWGTGERVPAGSAAFLNGYQIHNQEWDCVHEPAVVHPMAVVLATLVAHAEARGGFTGRDLLVGCSVAVDVATSIGMCARNRLRFFRPALCGALGAVAGIAAMERFDRATAWSALGLAYSQLSGTMQAHVEGSPVLPMQIGFNARAALTAIDLARHEIQGPRQFLTGPFGWFALIDPDADLAPLEALGRVSRVTELSHKPFPSGRATHGGVDGALTLMAQHGFAAGDIESLAVHAPPLVIQLVDRPAHAAMAPAYARLCLPYVVATALLERRVDVHDFEADALRRADRLALATRIRVVRDDNPSLNALAPQRVEVALRDGSRHAVELPAVLGSPGRPLDRERHLAKFRAACRSAAVPVSDARIEALVAAVDELEGLADVRDLVDLLVV
jgi:2-methylcitrate dehydratase PrpD